MNTSRKAEDVFYDPKVATKELIDEVYECKWSKLIKLTPKVPFVIIWQRFTKMHVQTCIWGNDKVTPPDVAEELINYYLILPYIDR
jgi:hypothetical protein